MTDSTFHQVFAPYFKAESADWDDFSAVWESLSFPKNAMLTREGEKEQYLYFIQSGVQRLYYVTPDGEEVVLGFSFDHSFSGVYDSFRTGKDSRYYLQALSASTALGIRKEKLDDMYVRFPQLNTWGRLFAESILFGRVEREVEMATLTAEERYASFVSRSPHCLQIIQQKYIASYLGMKPETLSRLRNKMV